MTEKTKIYKQVFINGGENYPEKTGQYWSGRNSLEKEMDLRGFNPDMDDNDFVWGNLDWYLLPVDQSELTDEMIEAEYPTDLNAIKIKEGFNKLSYSAEVSLRLIARINEAKREGAKAARDGKITGKG